MLRLRLRLLRPTARPPVRRSDSRRTLFGISLPTPSNEPLAGTIDGSGPPWLFILQVALALPTALWTYKCLMMVLFQRKIIYLPSVPPGGRNETLAERKGQLGGMRCDEIKVKSNAPTRWLRREVTLRGLQLTWEPTPPAEKAVVVPPRVVVVYLQGNAGTPLHRLPLFRRLLSPPPLSPSLSLTLLSIAPRSFWLSTRSTPTESSVLSDVSSMLSYARRTFPHSPLVLYGHSLGGAAAVLHLLRSDPHHPDDEIKGVILENPLPSIPYMSAGLAEEFVDPEWEG
ncbi:hypothetical protein RQP46_006267 [Phenoliferia psychrophenolica]